MGNVCRRALVSGKVQGVWYRGSTQRQANELGITGWAKNLPDGRVEVLMCGDEQSLAQLEAWLHQGPPMARVDSVDVAEDSLQWFDSFTTG